MSVLSEDSVTFHPEEELVESEESDVGTKGVTGLKWKKSEKSVATVPTSGRHVAALWENEPESLPRKKSGSSDRWDKNEDRSQDHRDRSPRSWQVQVIQWSRRQASWSFSSWVQVLAELPWGRPLRNKVQLALAADGTESSWTNLIRLQLGLVLRHRIEIPQGWISIPGSDCHVQASIWPPTGEWPCGWLSWGRTAVGIEATASLSGDCQAVPSSSENRIVADPAGGLPVMTVCMADSALPPSQVGGPGRSITLPVGGGLVWESTSTQGTSMCDSRSGQQAHITQKQQQLQPQMWKPTPSVVGTQEILGQWLHPCCSRQDVHDSKAGI